MDDNDEDRRGRSKEAMDNRDQNTKIDEQNTTTTTVIKKMNGDGGSVSPSVKNMAQKDNTDDTKTNKSTFYDQCKVIYGKITVTATEYHRKLFVNNTDNSVYIQSILLFCICLLLTLCLTDAICLIHGEECYVNWKTIYQNEALKIQVMKKDLSKIDVKEAEKYLSITSLEKVKNPSFSIKKLIKTHKETLDSIEKPLHLSDLYRDDLLFIIDRMIEVYYMFRDSTTTTTSLNDGLFSKCMCFRDIKWPQLNDSSTGHRYEHIKHYPFIPIVLLNTHPLLSKENKKTVFLRTKKEINTDKTEQRWSSESILPTLYFLEKVKECKWVKEEIPNPKSASSSSHHGIKFTEEKSIDQWDILQFLNKIINVPKENDEDSVIVENYEKSKGNTHMKDEGTKKKRCTFLALPLYASTNTGSITSIEIIGEGLTAECMLNCLILNTFSE
jgi:hypothetical protein